MKADVQRLCARLAAVPSSFQSPAYKPYAQGAEGAPLLRPEQRPVDVVAVVADLLRDRSGTQPTAVALKALRYRAKAAKAQRHDQQRYGQLVLLACWLLCDEVFEEVSVEGVMQLLVGRLKELAMAVHPTACVEDMDRREELVRVLLSGLDIEPEGETPKDAEDRLTALDSVHRANLFREAEQRERKRHRERLARLKAQEDEAKRQAARATFED